ncbi:MAG: ABC transporter ATP-binding protein [Ignavibacteriae bacterium]|nr:ABC transporter ATP-binding protein [Ignavibacteriota bacterium]MCB9217336.1 ABC transporter ATP-binding protein [Ignavibacteria bacterium]
MIRPIRPQSDESQPSFRERLRSLRYVPRLLRMVWETHRGYTLTIILIRILRSLVPVASLWVGKLIIDEVISLAATEGMGNLDRLWSLIGIEIAVVVTGEILSRISSLVESLLGDLFSNLTSVRMMEHSATLDLAQFEDPEFYDKMERARRQTVNRIALLTQLLNIGQGMITLASLAAGLLIYNHWLFLLLLLAVIPNFLGETRYAALGYSLLYSWTPQRRRLDYYRYIGASNETAREIKTFGLSNWITERYRILADQFYEENKRLSIRKAIVSTILSFVGEAGYYTAYVVILFDAVAGVITIGTLTFLSGSFMQARSRMSQILADASRIQEGSLYLKDLFDFFEVEPTITSLPNAVEVPVPLEGGFVFENVGFKYPGSDRWAVRNVSFTLKPGERIAFVGENGAGKTTLTKLIARLYDPTEGRILLDGRDLREYDLSSLRRAIGVIFQDFVKYELQFNENIGVGDIEQMGQHLDREEGEMIPDEMMTAADKSLASDLLERFPKGWNQMLGRRFDGGVNLSGGEWQKIALARAYLRETQILILDEPTAALDARAEYQVFLRFSELVKGRMAIIISHRFSTVRMADRIVVLRDGMVEEEGTHSELVESGGLYSELFLMQAEGYRPA